MMSDSGSVHFVYGDCTQPSKICPSEPTVIFSCVDDYGNWGCGGTFDALAKLSASIPYAYQQASEFGDLYVGDLHLIRINGRLLCSLFLILDCLITKYASDYLKTHKHTLEVVQVLMTGHRIQCSTMKQCSRPTGCVCNLLIEKLNP